MKKLFLAIVLSILANPVFSSEIINNKSVNIDQTWEGIAAVCDGSNNPQAGASRLTETYGPDQYRLGCNSGTGVFVGRRLAVPGAVPGLTNFFQMAVGVADISSTASNNYHLELPIEGPLIAPLAFGTASAQPLTLQFWYASGTNGVRSVALVEGVTDSRSMVQTFNYTGSNAPQFFTITFPADTGGTWSIAPATTGLKIIFDLGCGSTYETTNTTSWQNGLFVRTPSSISMIASTSNVFYLSGIQADPGSVALPFRYVSPAQDLLALSRYYNKTFPQGTAVATSAGAAGSLEYAAQIANTTAGGGVYWRYPTAMVYTPVITTFNPSAANAKWRNITASANSGTPVVVNSSTSSAYFGNPQITGDAIASHQLLHAVANSRLGGY